MPYNVFQTDQEAGKPLKYHTGAESALSVVVHSSVVSLDDDSRRILNAGTVLCQITSGHAEDKYGPYSKTASDGRESLDHKYACVTTHGVDVTLGAQEVAGYFAHCVFDLSQLVTGGISKHGASLTALEDAFPTCEFYE